MTIQKTQTNYSEVPVADVAAFFVGGYKFPDGTVMVQSEHFYDPAKGVFIFKMITETETDPEDK